jgi:hypothetical protein
LLRPWADACRITTRGDGMTGERVDEALEGRRDEGGRVDDGGSDATAVMEPEAVAKLRLSTKNPDFCEVPLSVSPRGRVRGRDDAALGPKVPDVPVIEIYGDGCCPLLLFRAVSERLRRIHRI